MNEPPISYVDPAKVKDAAMLAEFERCAREGTPRPESQAVRAHVPAVFWLRPLEIDHHQVMAGTDASMAPGFETAQAAAHLREHADYWARRDVAAASRVAE
jgi:hypothetical protein